MSTRRRVTITDVARTAGVSVATVSKVVNGRYGVAASTAERVREVIDQLGYSSSLVARSLRSSRTGVIGILVADFEPFSAEILKGLSAEAAGSGYELLAWSGFSGHAGREGWEKRSLNQLAGTLIDGAVVVTPTVVDADAGIPVVAVDPHTGPSGLPMIDSDNFHGALVATEHLIALGHRRIGFLAGRPGLQSAEERERGYREALEKAGIAFDPELIRVGGYREETADGASRELLTLDDRPTAVFAANDITAIRTMKVAVDLGLRVPADLSVVGFDNVPESVLADPPLTTIAQPLHEMGAEAFRLLLALLQDRGEPDTHVRLPTEFIERRSTQRPAAG
ncbi:MAG: LacI family transcriptional regulator [Actinomycetales bacterium]|nr:LacI family transcriptional regulator [Actinomycetales bacterium]